MHILDIIYCNRLRQINMVKIIAKAIVIFIILNYSQHIYNKHNCTAEADIMV